jgi:putative cell wall-binding protein
MSFISAWTSELHRLGYKSGAYGSSSSLMVDMSASVTSVGFVAPDNVWFAHWNQLQTTSDASSYPSFPDGYWRNHQRVHQYSGNLNQSWGGAGLNIDANWVDGAVAGAAVAVNYGTNVVGPGSSGFVFTGDMTYWRSGAPAGLKGLAYWTYSNGSTEYNGATWSPQLAPGRYNVEANIPSTNATANAPYTIRDAQGTTTKVVNQQSIKGYTSLGTYTARAGSSISVHVGDNDPNSTTQQIGVDAMAFRLVTTAPSSPGAVSAVGGNGQAVVSWGAASANGSPVTGYTVTASPGGRTAITTGATTATVTGLTNGTTYTFTVTATNAVGSSANSVLSNPVIPAATYTRLAGADRYGTAVAISQYAFQPQSPGAKFAVTVASGANFPDALAAGPVAAAQGGPLLLVPQNGVLPATVSTELTRLNPSTVHIAGGAAAVSTFVASQLKGFGTGTVLRSAGADRYGTAAQLAGLTGGLDKTVFIATGASFPDALGGSAAAGRLGGALMLTDRSALPQATASALTSGKPARVVILGGEAVIDPVVLSQVHTLLPGATVQRWAGADRYATAAAISFNTYPQGATTAYLASGADYPDALAGAPVASRAGAPLLLTSRDCVPASTLAELHRLGSTKIAVLGGTSAVSEAAANLTPCTG